MKKTVLLVAVLVLLFSLVGASKSYAVSAEKAQKAIMATQAYITKWESAGYAAPEAKKILRRARQVHKAGDYKRARKLAEKSLDSLKVEVKAGPRPSIEFHLSPKADLTKYKRIAVFEFNDAHDAPGSGDIITDLISSGLTEMGYDIIDRAKIEATLGGQKPEAGVIQMGKMLGVDAVITGTLSQYATNVTTARSRGFVWEGTFGSGGTRLGYSASVEVTIKMLDIETGSTVWQSNGSQTVPSTLIRPVAQRVINAILDEIPQKKTR